MFDHNVIDTSVKILQFQSIQFEYQYIQHERYKMITEVFTCKCMGAGGFVVTHPIAGLSI